MTTSSFGVVAATIDTTISNRGITFFLRGSTMFVMTRFPEGLQDEGKSSYGWTMKLTVSILCVYVSYAYFQVLSSDSSL